MEEFNNYCAKYFPKCSIFKRIELALDCLKEYIVYGTRLNNYFLYDFYAKTKSERRAFFTLGEGWEYRRSINGKEPHQKLQDKRTFNETFSDSICRDWICMEGATKDEFDKFCSIHTSFIEKPVDLGRGEGIKKVIVSDENKEAMYQMYAGKPIILEEVVVACDILNDLYPKSLNTIRVSTMLDKTKSKVTIIAATLKVGVGESVVDNFAMGSLAAAIDVDKGVVLRKAIDKKGNKYEFHPETGKLIFGITIPGWQKIIDMCTEAALSYPDAPYIGWDVAVSQTKDGQNYIPQLIEGNDSQCFLILQAPLGAGLKEKIMNAAC